MATFERKKTRREEVELTNLEVSKIEVNFKKNKLKVYARFYYGEESWDYEYKTQHLSDEEFEKWRTGVNGHLYAELRDQGERLLREKYIQDDDQ